MTVTGHGIWGYIPSSYMTVYVMLSGFQMYQYENPVTVLVHTEYILVLFICFRTDMYQYILGMYWYEP